MYPVSEVSFGGGRMMEGVHLMPHKGIKAVNISKFYT
jgi:hypothetical protein